MKLDAQTTIKWVKPDGIHLTLKFLGNIPVASTSDVTKVMTNAAKRISPFYLEVKTLGAFPNSERVQVVWLGLGGELDKLTLLQQLIETNLIQLGFTAEQRRFKPHLTLARLGKEVSSRDRQQLGKLIACTSPDIHDRINIDRIHLIRSQLTREGAIYSRISSVTLLKSI
jgi:2'-5' RNA ligase